MTVIVKSAQRAQQQRGFWSSPQSFRFRSSWATGTVYSRGDIVVSPTGSLYWCGVAHTAPAAFATGTEFSANSPWWMPLTTNGAFRGPYNANHELAGGDLVINPTTSEITRALFENSPGVAFDATKYGDFGIMPPFALFDPGIILFPAGMPQSKPQVQGLGLWPTHTRLCYPHVKPLVRVNASGDFASVTGGTVTADPDPIDPNGCPQITFTAGAGTIATCPQLASTVDISNSIVRFPLKASNYGNQQAVGTLGTSLTTGGPITKLPLDATGLQFPLGPQMQVVLDDGAGHTQTFTASDYVSATAGGSVTQIPVNSLTPSFAFPAGTTSMYLLGRGGITSLELQVSSDNFATHASTMKFLGATGNQQKIADTAWTWAGGGPGMWSTATGFANPANLAAVNAVRWVGKGNVSANTFSLSTVQLLANNGATAQAPWYQASAGDGRAKCCLWGDDNYAGHWTYLYATLYGFGFPLNEAAAGAIDALTTAFTVGQIQSMTEFGRCMFASHYYHANDGGADTGTHSGIGKETYIMRSRHSLRGAGSWGTDYHSWHDVDHPGAHNLANVRKYFAAIRGYISQDTTWETLPPVNPHYTHCTGASTQDTKTDATGSSIGTVTGLTNGVTYDNAGTPLPVTLTQNVAAGETITLNSGANTQTFTVATSTASGAVTLPVVSQAANFAYPNATALINPGAALKLLIDNAIANKGLAQIAWENVTSLSGHPEINNVCQYLDSQRANIDVVTFHEALKPWASHAG